MKAAWLARTGAAVALCCVFAAARAAMPLSVLGSLPAIEQASLSPDGTRLASVRPQGNTRTIVVTGSSDDQVIAAVGVGENKLRSLDWADDNRLLITTSVTAQPFHVGQAQEFFQLQVFDIKSKHFRRVPDPSKSPGVLPIIDGTPMVRHIEGRTVLFVQGMLMPQGEEGLFRVDLDSGIQQLLRKGGLTTNWLVDAAGEVAAQTEYSETDSRWELRIHHEGRMHEVTESHDPIDLPSILGFGPAPDTLLLARVEDGHVVWRLISLKDASVGEPMVERALLENPIEDQQTHRMIGGMHWNDMWTYVFFDPAQQKHWEAIVRAFKDNHVDFVSASADFQKILVQVTGPTEGYSYRLVDLATHHARLIGDVYEGLTTVLVKQKITYKAADGLEIPAYLTLPPGKEPKNLPLVVLVHGGPAARDDAQFDWWSQALADQGYAVLQPNYRGSALEHSFLEAGFGQWGRKMQTDVSDGVRHLVKEGVADASRVCIVGASYGGYAALAGATLDPGVYRCAVAVSGVSDVRRWLEWEAQDRDLDLTSVRYWDRFLGVKGPRDPVVDTISPIQHLDAVNIPVLLIHGKDDTVVPYEQSTLMNDALRHAGKAVEMVTLSHEDHWLSRSQTRLQMLTTSVAFLQAHNPP